MNKKFSAERFGMALVLLLILTMLLAACSATNTALPTLTTAPTTSATTTTTPAQQTITTANTTTTIVSAATIAPAAATTTPVVATTIAANSAGSAGVTVDVSGTKVTIKPGGGKIYNPGKPVTVTIWSSQTKGNGERFATLMKEFETANPNIKINIDNGNDTFSYQIINQKLAQAATTGGLPNIATGYENWVPAYVQANIALGLNKFISGEYGLTQQELEDYYPNMLARGIFPQYNNETYTWIFSNSAPAFYYNQDLLTQYGISKVPDTWDEFVAASKTITEKSTGKVIGYSFLAKGVSEMVAGSYARGGTVYDYAKKQFVFTDKPMVDHLTMLYDGVKGGYFTTADQNVPNADQNAFVAQKTAFYISSTASRSFIADAIAKGGTDIKPFNWNAKGLPYAVPVTRPLTTLYGGAALGFKGKSEEEDLATWAVMKYMGSAAFQAKWASASGYVPATKSTLDAPEYKAFVEKAPQNSIPKLVLQYATAFEPKLGQWEGARNLFDENVNNLFQGQGDVASTLKKIDEETNKLLK